MRSSRCICPNCANFVERHGVGAFPLAGRNIPWYSVWAFILRHSPPGEPSQTSRGVWGRIKAALKSVPVLRQCLRVAAIIPREIFHSVGGYRFLRLLPDPSRAHEPGSVDPPKITLVSLAAVAERA